MADIEKHCVADGDDVAETGIDRSGDCPICAAFQEDNSNWVNGDTPIKAKTRGPHQPCCNPWMLSSRHHRTALEPLYLKDRHEKTVREAGRA